MIEQYENFKMCKDLYLPVRIMGCSQAENVEELMVK